MTLFDHIKTVLEQNENFCIDGKIFKNKVVEAALKLDPALLSILLKDERAKKTFFQEVEGLMIFDKVKFQKFVSNKEFLPDSFTAFKNKIGLTANGEYLTEAKEVVLDFPFKDCVLEGGQTKEDQKRQEIFWNETLAPDEIDRLFEPKVLTNWKRYDKDGEHEVKSISEDDNLIIKGNNLIALHSIKKVYAGKVKLIYIDPPYNTGSDGFNYNDGFNHSSWLTFMKNRLEVAKELLSNDGIIYISCDDRENAYLKVLCDEIFERENFITNLIWRKKAGGGNDSHDIAVEHEYILAYRKKNNGIYKMPLDEKTLKSYNQKDEKFSTHGGFKTKDLNDPSLSDSAGLHFDIECPDGTVLKGTENQWKCNLETFKKRLNDNRIVFKKIGDKWKVHYKIYLNEEKGELRYNERGVVIPKGRNLSSILYDVALNKDGSNDIKKIFSGSKPFSYPKPVELIKTLILSATNDNDIILDFFAGSGTTGQAVLEVNSQFTTNRKFILIEQMNYIENITVKRIIKSLQKYNLPSSFLYFELFNPFTQHIENLISCENKEELLEYFTESVLPNFSYFHFDIEKLFINSGEISLDELKKLMHLVIDKNQYYLPYSEISDEEYKIKSNEQIHTNNFYNQHS